MNQTSIIVNRKYIIILHYESELKDKNLFSWILERVLNLICINKKFSLTLPLKTACRSPVRATRAETRHIKGVCLTLILDVWKPGKFLFGIKIETEVYVLCGYELSVERRHENVSYWRAWHILREASALSVLFQGQFQGLHAWNGQKVRLSRFLFLTI